MMEPLLPLPEAGTDEANAEVLISGGGPVGLMLGVLLKQAGVDVVIVDPHVFPGQGAKAAVTMPRSFEQLELANVGSRLRDLGRPVTAARFCLGGGIWAGEFTGFTNPSMATRQSPRAVGQNFVEEELNRRFMELGGRFYRGARFVSYAEVGDSVQVNLEHAPYARPPIVLPPMPASVTARMATTMIAKYVVGCDGKQSAVRTAMGASYEGHDYTDIFLLADVEIPLAEVERTGYHKHSLHFVMDAPTGSLVLLVRLQETKWRTYFCQRGLSRDNLTPEFIQEKWHQFIPMPGPFVPTQFKDMAFFEVSCKLASTYRKGRVLLAGDAAHCHSPAGGQGMNTGLQDSANLAWKVASVLKGHASDKLLDSYELERRPVAEWVLSTSDRAFCGMTTQTSASFNIARRMFIRMILSLAPKGAIPPTFIKDKLFGLSVSYADTGTCSVLGTAPKKGTIRAGDRLPDIACCGGDDHQGQRLTGGRVFTLELLASAPHTALRVMLVAETSKGCPSKLEIESALAGLKPLLTHGVPLQPLIYMHMSNSASNWFRGDGCAAYLSGSVTKPPFQATALRIATDVLAGFTPLRVLVPVDTNAHKLIPCAEIVTKLGLGAGGKAVLVVRPDGYIAVSQLGSWDVKPVVSELQELGVLMPAP